MDRFIKQEIKEVLTLLRNKGVGVLKVKNVFIKNNKIFFTLCLENKVEIYYQRPLLRNEKCLSSLDHNNFYHFVFSKDLRNKSVRKICMILNITELNNKTLMIAR